MVSGGGEKKIVNDSQLSSVCLAAFYVLGPLFCHSPAQQPGDLPCSTLGPEPGGGGSSRCCAAKSPGASGARCHTCGSTSPPRSSTDTAEPGPASESTAGREYPRQSQLLDLSTPSVTSAPSPTPLFSPINAKERGAQSHFYLFIYLEQLLFAPSHCAHAATYQFGLFASAGCRASALVLPQHTSSTQSPCVVQCPQLAGNRARHMAEGTHLDIDAPEVATVDAPQQFCCLRGNSWQCRKGRIAR